MKFLPNLRVVILALVFAVAAALPFITTSIQSRDFYFFDVTLTSTNASTTQVFWDFGRGLSEYDSSRQPLRIEPKPVVYRYMLPMGEIQALRFDPADGPGTFTLAQARVVDYRGRVAHAFRPDDFIAFTQIARLEINGDTLRVETTPDATDPILLLRLAAPLHLRSDWRIWFHFGAPVAVPVFLLGLLLGTPAVAGWLHRRLAPAGGWLAARPLAAITLVACATVAVQSHPVIFFGRSFATPINGSLMLYGEMPTLPGMTQHQYTATMSSDTGALLFQHLYYPMVQHEALLRHGELPLWNRYSLCGEPLLGQGQSMFGDPFNFLTILADGAAWAWDVRFVLAHWLLAAGLGFTVWRLTRHLAAALLVTVGGGFIAFFTFRLVHPANFSVCYAPWILWAWTGLVQADTPRRESRWLGALFAANWLVLTSGTVKEAYMLIACLNLAGLAWLGLLPESRGRRGRLLGLAAATGGIFVLVAAPFWMSFLTALRHSFTGYDNPGQADPLSLTQLLGFFDDIFYRQNPVDERVIAPALNFLFMLGVLWWCACPRLWRDDRAGRAVLLAALVPFALAFGVVPSAVILKIPYVRSIMHVGNTFSCPLMILAAVLAGCGFRDALARLADRGWWPVFGRVLALAGALAVAYFLSIRGRSTSPFFHGYVPALALAGLALPLGVRWAARMHRPGLLYAALLLGGPLLLWRHSQYNHTVFEQYAFVPGARCDLQAPSPAVAFINEDRREPGRVVGWEHNLFPSYNTALHLEGLYGVDALRNRYYQELAKTFDLQRVWEWDAINKEADAPLLRPAHDLLNVTYYLASHRGAPRVIAGLRLLVPRDLDVYESPSAWPRAFFTDRLAVYASVKDFAEQVRAGDGHPFAAIQTGEAEVPALSAELADRTVRPATGYRLTANTTTFVIDAPGPGLAVLTESFYRDDFQVTVDGRPAQYFRVNHAFKGVAIAGAGRHEITFAYWPEHFTLALVLGVAGLLLLAAGAHLLWHGGWRRSPSDPSAP
jgi:hypothetical protein